MKSKKTVLTLALIAVISVTSCAQQYDPESDFEASPQDGGRSVVITKYLGSKWEVRIPPRIQGLLVTHIGGGEIGGAFSRKNLISVTIPNSVTTIGDNAFSVNQLTRVAIPNSVTHIGQGAFYSNKQLTSITISNSVNDIGNYAFGECDSLTAINVDAGNSVFTSENGVLYNKDKSNLYTYPKGKTAVSFTIPNSVTSIGDYAFYGCTSLTSMTIPNTVTSIGDNAFYGCTGLIGRFTEVLQPLATIMSGYEFVPMQERRDQYDDILSVALTSQSAIVRIFAVCGRNTLDMDEAYIGRLGSTPTGQYAPSFAKENGVIEKSMFTDFNEILAGINDLYTRRERVKPMLFNVNGQDVWILRIEIPIINTRTLFVLGTVGAYCDIR